MAELGLPLRALDRVHWSVTCLVGVPSWQLQATLVQCSRTATITSPGRARERERERAIYIYIYIYTHIRYVYIDIYTLIFYICIFSDMFQHVYASYSGIQVSI